MIGHDDVGIHAELETPAHSFERRFEDLPAGFARKQPAMVVAAECNKVALSSVLETLQSPWHGCEFALADLPCL